MSRFKTLLLREWMQHHRGWLAVMLVPPVLILLLFIFAGSKHLVVDGHSMDEGGPAAIWLGTVMAVTAIVFAITCIVVALQVPGIARRDQQDRSIEFWVSLPTPHTQSVGATLLAHALLVPMMGLTIGFLSAQIVAMVSVIMVSGPAGLMDIPWGAFLPGSIATFVRLAFGVLLASLWMLPILLLMMVASAWLKRWGVPVLIAALITADVVLKKVYGISIVGDTLYSLWAHAMRSLLNDIPPGWKGAAAGIIDGQWPVSMQWLAEDAFASLAYLAQPIFVFAMAASAGCFSLLVLRRRRA